MKQWITILLAAWVMALTPIVQAADDPLVIYSGRGDRLVKPVLDAFTEATGIPVMVHSAESTALINKLRLEGARTDADLFISNDAGTLQIGSQQDLFRPIDAGVVAPIPEHLRAPDRSWVGLSARARAIVINTDRDDLDFVSSVLDLADSRLKGRLAMTSSANESFIGGTTVYMERFGVDRTLEWLEGLRRNVDGTVYHRHRQVVNDVASGRKDVGLVNHYYIHRHLADHPDAPIRMVIPDQGEDGIGVAWNTTGIAISRHTGRFEDALRLVTFLVSDEGQQLFAEVNREYPTRPGVATADDVPPPDTFKVADVPMNRLGERRSDTIDLIERVGLP